MMHLIIANRIAERLPIADKPSFLLGSLAPDAVADKNTSHFFKGDVRDYTRHIDYNGFLHKYSAHVKNYYVLGYFAHLIADDIWLRGFNLSWLRNRMDADPELYALSHNDFRLLNGKLLQRYAYADEIRAALSEPTSSVDLEEVSCEEAAVFVPSALEDFEYDKDVLNKPLQVFTFDQIIGYIETSADLAAQKLEPLLA